MKGKNEDSGLGGGQKPRLKTIGPTSQRAIYFARRFGCLAHATASTTSSSTRPSSASLAHTASARWMRTGVRMIWPPWAFTSKYSTAPKAFVTLLGSVSRFLEVNLASMAIRPMRKVRVSTLAYLPASLNPARYPSLPTPPHSANISRRMARAGWGSIVVIFLRSRSTDTVRIWSRATDAVLRCRRIV